MKAVDEYQSNKRDYSKGLTSFSNRLKEHSEQTVQAAREEAKWFMIAALGLGLIVALILLVGCYSLTRILRLRSAFGAE